MTQINGMKSSPAVVKLKIEVAHASIEIELNKAKWEFKV